MRQSIPQGAANTQSVDGSVCEAFIATPKTAWLAQTSLKGEQIGRPMLFVFCTHASRRGKTSVTTRVPDRSP